MTEPMTHSEVAAQWGDPTDDEILEYLTGASQPDIVSAYMSLGETIARLTLVRNLVRDSVTVAAPLAGTGKVLKPGKPTTVRSGWQKPKLKDRIFEIGNRVVTDPETGEVVQLLDPKIVEALMEPATGRIGAMKAFGLKPSDFCTETIKTTTKEV